MIQASYAVRTPSAADQPSAGHRPHRVEVPERRDALSFFAHLNVSHRDGTGTPGPEPAEPGGLARPADGKHGAATSNPQVTAEELTILTLMANGLTLDSVAIRVAMSPRTLSRRLRCVCDRLGVAHPIQAIVWAAHRGLV